MRNTRQFFLSVIFCTVLFTMVGNSQTTAFTFQGRLDDSNVAANGAYQLQFKLYDMGGTQVGPTLSDINATIVNGIFTVQLDFGAAPFNGTARQIEIAVRRGASDPYVALAPRQPVSSTPYSIRSLTAASADSATTAVTATSAISATTATSAATATTAASATNAAHLGGVAASQYVLTGDARLTDARSPTVGSNNYVQNSVATQASTNFNISGNGTAGGALSGNTINATTQFNMGGTRILGNSGQDNVFVGVGSGQVNASGFGNSFLGRSAGRDNTTGDQNTFVGAFSGQINTTGDANSFFGNAAGTSNTTGDSNSFFGKDAGFSNATGVDNSFFGRNAGLANTNGSRNSFFGRSAGVSNTGATSSSFFGYEAGLSNTSANENSYFGSRAGRANTVGYSNSAFGYEAGTANNGNYNALFGYRSGYAMTSGGLNAFFGAATGTTNVAGDYNTALGATADFASPNLTNATAIGAYAVVGQSNSLVLGSINGVNFANADTKVGIGTTTPSERLTIKSPTSSYGFVHTDGTITVGSFVGGTGNGGYLGTKSNHPLHLFVNDGGPSLTINTTGTVAINTLGIAGSLQLCRNVSNQVAPCSSSLRYKTNVASYTPGMSFVNRLQPISFDWKDGGMKDIGFGAEDVAKIDPRFAVFNEQGEVEGLKYDRLSVAFVNAFKEQQLQIDAQQKQIVVLTGLLCSMKPRAPICRK